jgi:hypothetical protein
MRFIHFPKKSGKRKKYKEVLIPKAVWEEVVAEGEG